MGKFLEPDKKVRRHERARPRAQRCLERLQKSRSHRKGLGRRIAPAAWTVAARCRFFPAAPATQSCRGLPQSKTARKLPTDFPSRRSLLLNQIHAVKLPSSEATGFAPVSILKQQIHF
jgi:hypothetical protein